MKSACNSPRDQESTNQRAHGAHGNSSGKPMSNITASLNSNK